MRKGSHHSEESKLKASLSHKGHVTSDETRLKLSLSHKGKKYKPMTEEHKLKLSLALKGRSFNKGRKLTEEQKARLSLSMKGKRHHTEEYKIALSERMKGNKINVGRKASTETIEKLSKMRKGHIVTQETRDKISKNISKEKHPQWKGGLSEELYPSKFNNILRESIRKRDEYKCQLCGKIQNGIKLDIHHIDYNKDNIDRNNLISLCRSCHTKTTFKDREYYTEYFNNMLNLEKCKVLN